MAERYGRPVSKNAPAPTAKAMASAVPAPAAEPDPDDTLPMPSTASSAQTTTIPRERPPTVGGPVPTNPGAEVERIDSQVQKAQEQLINLRRQQEQIERQKRELEELSRRQEELETGRSDMTEKLTRALVVLERQGNEAQKRVQQLHLIRESFASHLSAIESINPKAWASTEMPKELNRALGMVDHARTEYSQQRARFAADVAEGIVPTEDTVKENPYEDLMPNKDSKAFLYWLKAGVAFTLPLLLLGIIGLVIFCFSLATK